MANVKHNGAYRRRVRPLWRDNFWLKNADLTQLNDAVLTEFEQHPTSMECPRCDGIVWWNAFISMHQCAKCKVAKYALGWMVPIHG